jgi:NCS1 family nucleobase:cation symporter-1
MPILSVGGTLFAYFSIVIVNFGDYSRYVKDESQLNKGNLSLILNLILFSILSVSIVVGSDIILTQNFIKIDQLLTNPTDIIGKFNNIYVTIAALFFILAASISTNLIANYIPSQNSLLNFFPKSLSLKSSGLTIATMGFLVGSFWLVILSQIGILSLIDTAGCFFGPLFGIIVSDYYLIRNNNTK